MSASNAFIVTDVLLKDLYTAVTSEQLPIKSADLPFNAKQAAARMTHLDIP